MLEASVNLETMFTEAGGDYFARLDLAKGAGFTSVEIWGTANKDVTGLAHALRATGVSLSCLSAEPRANLAFPETDLAPFLDGLTRSVADAVTLNCPRVVVSAGIGFPGYKRDINHARLVDAFSEALRKTEGSNVTLVLEPVNSRVDHPGVLLDRTADAASVIRSIGSDRFRLLYDVYHSITQGEQLETEVSNARDVIDYVQIADVPGRGEPGSGAMDWPRTLRILSQAGYHGPVGCECLLSTDSERAANRIRAAFATA